MKITSIGGGPGGLYASILLKKADPSRQVTVLERNAPDDTFGFGVVFSRATLSSLADADAATHDELLRSSAQWDPVEIWYGGERIRARGNSFAAVSRKTLLQILQHRARDLGVDLQFGAEVTDPASYRDADLVLGADGVNSVVRRTYARSFRPRAPIEGSKFIWLGTTKPLDSFTFVFQQNEHGRFQAHAYPYEEHLSTFIVEADRESWQRAGLDHAGGDELMPGQSDHHSIAYLTKLFADYLGEHELIGNNSRWLDWTTITNQSWRHENIVLLGDAAHTAHFSIGSGTKLAMDDAIELARSVEAYPSLDGALANYEAVRKLATDRIQDAASESLAWFNSYGRYLRFAPPEFAYSLLTRSDRIDYDNLRRRDPSFIAGFNRWFAQHRGAVEEKRLAYVAPDPAFIPVKIAGVTLQNRIVAMPLVPDTAVDGTPSEDMPRELMVDGPALVIVPQVAISSEARVTEGSPGLYEGSSDTHWAQMLEQVTSGRGDHVLGLQLVHAGARGSTRPRSTGVDQPLPASRGWPIVAASAVPYLPGGPIPQAIDQTDMIRGCEDFVGSARRAAALGFRFLELDFGHGYLLGSFLSPLTNHRTDGYGGDLEARLRYPLEVLIAVRDAWPQDLPLSVCMSASDGLRGGISEDDAVEAARRFAGAGADLIHVVTGQTGYRGAPSYDAAHNANWSDVIRNRAQVPVMVSGHIPSVSTINDVLAAGRADLCVLGRPMLREPHWLHNGDQRTGHLAEKGTPSWT